MKQSLINHSLLYGTILMFLLTWPIDLINACFSQGWISFQIPLFPAVLLGYGFVVGAGFMTYATEGNEKTKQLFKRYLHWRLSIKWYIYAFLLIPVITVIAVFTGFKLQSEPFSFENVLAHSPHNLV